MELELWTSGTDTDCDGKWTACGQTPAALTNIAWLAGKHHHPSI